MREIKWLTYIWLFLLITLLSLATYSAFAAEVNCYSGKVRIYHGFGDDFVFSENFMSFTEYKTKHLILVRGDCIVLTPILKGDRFHAIDTGQEKYWA